MPHIKNSSGWGFTYCCFFSIFLLINASEFDSLRYGEGKYIGQFSR
jgi:hypothetical protein